MDVVWRFTDSSPEAKRGRIYFESLRTEPSKDVVQIIYGNKRGDRLALRGTYENSYTAWFYNDELTILILADSTQGPNSYGVSGFVEWEISPPFIPQRYPGQEEEFDSPRPLYHNWHRWYDPTIGRYLQPDPINLGQLSQTMALLSAIVAEKRKYMGVNINIVRQNIVPNTFMTLLETPYMYAQMLVQPDRLNPYTYSINNPLYFIDRIGGQSESNDNGWWAVIKQIVCQILPPLASEACTMGCSGSGPAEGAANFFIESRARNCARAGICSIEEYYQIRSMPKAEADKALRAKGF